MRKKDSEKARMLKEILETAQGLKAHGVMSKVDMARVRALCEEPPAYPPTRPGVLLQFSQPSPRSARPCLPHF